MIIIVVQLDKVTWQNNRWGEMENIKHDSLDSWAESNAGRRVLHSNNVPVIIAVVLKTQKEGNIT